MVGICLTHKSSRKGVSVCKPLSAELDLEYYNLVLINPLPYRVWLPSVLRYVVSGTSPESNVFLPYDKLFASGKGIFVQGKVAMIEPGNGRKGGDVILENGSKIQYHILVLAMGSRWEGPPAIPTIAERVPDYVAYWQDNFSRANHVVIVGGGAIGTELCGEIKDKWPNKRVTLVHASIHLLNPTYPDKFRVRVEKGLEDRGVEIVLNDWLDFEGTGPQDSITVTTRFKHVIHGVDFIVHARGPRPNTNFVSKSLGAHVLSPETGRIKIRPTLQLVDYDDIFAAGDAMEWPEQKQAIKANKHGRLIASNISSMIQGFPLRQYKGSMEIILLTNGRNRGATYFDILSGVMLKDWLTRRMKSRDLLRDVFRQQQGYT
ncbi:FAD/NAD(P)-binding domain-containing protein [Flagelloscypha sp. PMI_526]|nr:FAD/NAD(P)-binding domain-containing protein [Flagelloscypha sp. PMI_526]